MANAILVALKKVINLRRIKTSTLLGTAIYSAKILAKHSLV